MGRRTALERPTKALGSACTAGSNSAHVNMATDENYEGKSRPSVRRIALDIRPRSFGFVVLEDAMVLDSGVRTCDQEQSDDCLVQRFRRIVARYDPAAVITLRRRLSDADRAYLLSKSLTRIVEEVGAELLYTSPPRIHRYFHRHGAITKHDIALVIAKLLPELAWQIPAKRKPWESEPYWASVFDAAASVVPHIFPIVCDRP